MHRQHRNAAQEQAAFPAQGRTYHVNCFEKRAPWEELRLQCKGISQAFTDGDNAPRA